MFYVSTIVVPIALLALACWLVIGHLRAWRRAQQDEAESEELEFSRRQLRRRVQTSALLGLLAIGLCVGQLIPADRHPTLFVCFWFGMLLLLAWMVMLALGDLVLGRQYVARLKLQRQIAEAQLNAELERVRGKLQQDHNDRETAKHDGPT
jgi:hypothetical protein